MSPKLWRMVPMAVVVGGCLLSGWIAEQLWQYERTQWQARAQNEARRLTESLHEWIENTYLPLSSLATLVEMSPGIEENMFLKAVAGMESRATSVSPKQVGLFEFRQNRWDRRASTAREGEQRLLDLDDAIGGPGLIELLEHAQERPNEWKMSRPVQSVAGSADARVALALPGMPEIVLVGTVDLERVARSLLATRSQSGIVPQLYFDQPGSDPIPLLTIPPPSTVASTVRAGLATAGRVMTVEWRVGPSFSGGMRETAGWTALAAGCALSCLMGLLLWRQLVANLTIRRRVDEATATLQAERAQLQSLLDACPVGVSITVDGTLLFANPQMTRMSQTTVGDKTGKLYVDPHQRAAIVKRLETEPIVHNVPVQMRTGSGNIVDLLLTMMHHDFHGQPSYLAWLVDVTSMRDTERAMAEARLRAEDATRSKSHFLANMSHEIRTPMNAIIGMSHLALQFELAAKPRNYIDKVHRASVHLLGIINDILDFSKIEADKMVLEAVDFPLDEVMEHLANLVGLKAQQGGLELHFDMRCNLPTRLVGDPLRLGQVLINLGNNAIKFTKSGDVVVGVEEVTRDDHDVELHFWVRDSGIGMSEEQCAQLFQAFSQADASTTRKYGGTGLGLAISKRLVELMDGRIWVESQLGLGSTFHFTVRLGLLVDAQVSRMFHAEELRGLRVLVVDDNAVARGTLASLIDSFGMQAHAAAASDEALVRVSAQQADGTPYALAFIDWKMPGVDGISCAARLQQQFGQQTPPVMLMAAHGSDDDARAIAQSRGVQVHGVMVKPFTPSSLLESIGIGLDKASLLDRRTPVRIAQDEEAQAQLRGARLLLVEDNAMNQELALALLEGAGIEVVVAQHGADALRILGDEAPFDGVLMDCQMPVMDGFAATRELRLNPAWATLPVIAMTANAMAGDREMVLAVGMNDHIAKPINVTEMFATIARWVRPARPADALAQADGSDGIPERRAQERRGPAASIDGLDLSALEGIDTRAGLARTMNNPQLYRRLLARFLEGQGGFAQRFDEARLAGDFDTARRDAHTLKGTAGSIGAQAVAVAAAEVERLCDGTTDADALGAALQKTQQALDPVLAALRAMIESAAASSSAAAEAPAAVDTARISRLLQGIHLLLKDSDAQSIEAGEELLELCRNGPWASSARDLKNALDGYDFDRALVLARDFIAQLEAAQATGEAAPMVAPVATPTATTVP